MCNGYDNSHLAGSSENQFYSIKSLSFLTHSSESSRNVRCARALLGNVFIIAGACVALGAITDAVSCGPVLDASCPVCKDTSGGFSALAGSWVHIPVHRLGLGEQAWRVPPCGA